MAKLLAQLANDETVLRDLLDKAGIPEGALSPQTLIEHSEFVLGKSEQAHAVEAWEVSNDKNNGAVSVELPLRDGINAVRLSSVAEREVDWQRLAFTARGKLTLLTGPPGVGKTWLMVDHIARLTTGRPYHNFPEVERTDVMGCDPSPRRNALFVSSEDGAADTILPRLKAMGGDPSRVHWLNFVGNKKESSKHSLSLVQHVSYLNDFLRAHPMVELVVFDPISAVLGKIDSHRDTDVRSTLTPLAEVAEANRVAVVAIAHHNKSLEGSAINRSSGSVAFVAAARLVWQVTADPKTAGRSLFLPVKCNLTQKPKGKAFRLTSAGVEWEPADVDTTADEALQPLSVNRAPAKNDAKAFLLEVLKDGPVPVKEVEERASYQGIKARTLDTAKRELKVVSKKIGGEQGFWEWSLPPEAQNGKA